MGSQSRIKEPFAASIDCTYTRDISSINIVIKTKATKNLWIYCMTKMNKPNILSENSNKMHKL